MFSGSIIIGLTIIGFAIWLQWNDSQGWPNEQFETKLDVDYHTQRSRSRRRLHAIIGACGALVIAAAFAGPGRVWIGAWMCVMVGLVTVVALAGFDAFRTTRYHRDKRPIRRRNLSSDDK